MSLHSCPLLAGCQKLRFTTPTVQGEAHQAQVERKWETQSSMRW